MPDILEIKNVPPDEGRGIMPTNLFNPTDIDFVFKWDGKEYTVPAGKGASFPEFIARHGAKHLAELIISRKWKVKVNEELANLPPGSISDKTAKATPRIEIQRMMEALLKGTDEAFAQLEAPIVERAIVEPEKKLVKAEEPEEPEESEEEKELKRKEAIKAKRIESLKKATAVRQAKQKIKKGK